MSRARADDGVDASEVLTDEDRAHFQNIAETDLPFAEHAEKVLKEL
jgi:hypothetical protein